MEMLKFQRKSRYFGVIQKEIASWKCSNINENRAFWCYSKGGSLMEMLKNGRKPRYYGVIQKGV